MPMVAAEKPHCGCIRVPFMNSTTRSESMRDSIRDCNGWFSSIGFSSDRFCGAARYNRSEFVSCAG